jgi:ankyrin repeat protein
MDDIGRVLIKAGAQLSKAGRSRDGSTHLHLAAQCQDAEAVQRLLAAGFHVDHADNVSRVQVLCILNMLFVLTMSQAHGWAPAYSVVVAADASCPCGFSTPFLHIPLPRPSSLLQRGQTALHDAAYAGYTHMVEELIKGGANVDVRDVRGQTPLAQAAWNGHAEVARLLLDAGAHPELGDPVSQPVLPVIWWCCCC